MRHLPVDVEHLGIRVAVPLLAIAALVLALWGGPQLLDALALRGSQLGLCLLPAAILASVGTAFLSDRLLKRYWPSKRALLVDDEYLILREKDRPDQVIAWGARINLLAWRFTIRRRGRVPKGHVCLAAQLLQDEKQLTVYTFLNPKHSDRLEHFEVFTPLVPRSSLSDGRLSLRVAGEQRRLLQAEDERWRNGAELTTEDFILLWGEIWRHRDSFQV